MAARPGASFAPSRAGRTLEADARSTGRKLAAELLEATARGDRAAFRALYEATAPKLLRHHPAYHPQQVDGGRGAAGDLRQDLAEGRALLAGSRAADGVARGDRPQPRDRPDPLGEGRAAAALGDDEAILERLAAPAAGDPAMRRGLRTCLAGLDEEARDCVVLAYCSGYSREELAERFKRPVGTIKTLLHRSLRLLRACLERE